MTKASPHIFPFPGCQKCNRLADCIDNVAIKKETEINTKLVNDIANKVEIFRDDPRFTPKRLKDKYPEFSLFSSLLDESADLLKDMGIDFFIFDLWLPDNRDLFNAIYVILEEEKSAELSNYSKHLGTIYNNGGKINLEKKILDTNKIPRSKESFQPYILSSTPKQNYNDEYYVDLSLCGELNSRYPQIKYYKNTKTENGFNDYVDDLFQKIIHLLADPEEKKKVIDLVKKHTSENIFTYFYGEKCKAEYSHPFVSFITHCFVFQCVVPFEMNGNNQIQEYIYFPVTNLAWKEESENKGKNQWVGGLLIPFNKATDPDDRTRFRMFSRKLVTSVFSHFLISQIKDAKQVALDNARKSVITNILARNYSHHMGAHVINRTIMEKILQRFGLEKWMFGLDEDITPYLRYLNYLKTKLDFFCQQRNEFISDLHNVSTLSGNSVRFFNQVIFPFIENTLILDNISHSEQLRYSNNPEEHQLRIRVFIQKEKNFIEVNSKYDKTNPELKQKPFLLNFKDEDKKKKIICPVEYDDQQYESLFNNRKICDDQGDVIEDIEIDLPGSIGEHSFYSILENYIRNTSKHHQQIFTNNQLEVYIIIANEEDHYYQVYLTDNTNFVDDSQFQNIIEGKQEVSKLVDEDGTPKKGFIGIADMAICSLILKGEDDFSSKRLQDSLCVNRWKERPELRDKLIRDTRILNNYASRPKDRDLMYYSFRLKKAQKICYLTKGDFSDADKQRFARMGIVIRHEVAQIEGNTAFQFAIIDASFLEAENYKSLFLKLPFRIIINGVSELSKPLILKLRTYRRVMPVNEEVLDSWFAKSKASVKTLLQKCWQIWLGRWPDLNQNKLILYADDETLEESRSIFRAITKKKNKYPFEVEIFNGEAPNKNINFKNPLIFDHHGSVLNHCGLSGYHDIKGMEARRSFYSILGKNSLDFSSLFYTKNNDLILYELAEAARIKVLIVDERIAQESQRRISYKVDLKVEDHAHRQNKTLFDAYWAANVFVCTHWQMGDGEERCLIEEQEASENQPFLKVKVDANTFQVKYQTNHVSQPEVYLKDIDIVVFHRTILDKLGNMNQKGLFVDEIRKTFPFLIVNSGGGYPRNLGDNFKYYQYSALSRFFGKKEFAKYSFVQNLLTLTRKKK